MIGIIIGQLSTFHLDYSALITQELQPILHKVVIAMVFLWYLPYHLLLDQHGETLKSTLKITEMEKITGDACLLEPEIQRMVDGKCLPEQKLIMFLERN